MFEYLWPGSARHDNTVQQHANIMSAHTPTPTLMTQTSFLNPLKRKRGQLSPISPSVEQPVIKRCAETMSEAQIPSADAHNSLSPRTSPLHQLPANQEKPRDVDAGGFNDFSADTNSLYTTTIPATPADRPYDISASHTRQQVREIDMITTTLQNTLEAHFNLETLLKHREARLIDQELAKCQIAYEQLRRCQIIPYPSQSNDNASMIAVSDGSGPVYNLAPHSSPWGLVEGAYTRHYEKWLLPSSAFDENIIDEAHALSSASKKMPDRATRGLISEQASAGSQSRSQRGSTTRLQALPHGYPEPKEEKGPMIVKRSSDSRMVKLVCLDCRRSNFNSVQGFINHCRIAHTRQFASHDAAIEASGEEIDVEAEGVGTEMSAPQGAASAGLVHPMIRSARPPTSDPTRSPSSNLNQKVFATGNSHPSPIAIDPPALSTPRDTSISNSTLIPFKPSPHTPHLSALFAKLGRGGDLDGIVTEAKMREEIDLQESDFEDSMDELDEPAPQSRSTRGVVQSCVRPASSNNSMPMTSATPDATEQKHSSQIGHRVLPNLQSHAFQSPVSTSSHQDEQYSSIADIGTPYNLSPNTTDPHPAPSLVSDDGDYDNTHSESEASSHPDIEDDADHYLHPSLLDHEDLELGESSGINLENTGKIHGPTAGTRSRPSTAIHGDEPHGERHVSFMSPVGKHRRLSKQVDE